MIMFNRNESYLMEEQGTNKQNDTTPGTYKLQVCPPTSLVRAVPNSSLQVVAAVTKGAEENLCNKKSSTLTTDRPSVQLRTYVRNVQSRD